jgi:hypothetical protein
MDRRTAIKMFATGGVAVAVCDIPGGEPAAYVAELDFDTATFSGTITEPDGTVNNLCGYHGIGQLPPLGGEPWPPAGGSTADVVLSGVVDYPTGFTVPSGQVWEFDPATPTTVRSGGNIVVNGTLRATPGPSHRIEFYGINESTVVGGMAMAPVATDIGLWVDGGVLDISGVPKAAWNRTGSDPSWLPTDELIVTPTAPGSYLSAPYTGTIPSASSATMFAGTSVEKTRTYSAEVVNLSRSFVIEATNGRAHVMIINATQPQRLEYVELVKLGPTGKLGRYPLHVHMNGDGTDGSLFRGNVAKNCGNHAFVPHRSNGIDMSNSIAYRTQGDAFWWDKDDESERVNWNRCGAIETKGSGFNLGEGFGSTCIESFAVGTIGTGSVGGILWPESANGDRSVWLVDGCVAHNNATHGFRAWQNDAGEHSAMRCVSYRNQYEGFSHGAYRNRYRYSFCVAFGNELADFAAHANGAWIVRLCWFERVTLHNHRLPQNPNEVSVFEAGLDWYIGQVTVNETANLPGVFRFDSTHFRADLLPSDFDVIAQLSTITVNNSLAADFTLAP